MIDFDAIAKELGHEIGKPTERAYAVTGEPYVTLTDCGIHFEGQAVAVEIGTEANAWERYEAMFRRYLGLRKGVLYWRARPICENRPSSDHRPGTFSIYSRLLISEAPALDADDAMLAWQERVGTYRASMIPTPRPGFSV